MLLIAVLVFLAIQALPGSFADLMVGPTGTDAARAAITERFGLDRPLPVQFVLWLGGVVQGDFGISMVTQTGVSKELLRRAAPTLQLALGATLLAALIGIPLGLMAAMTRSGSVSNAGFRVVAAIGVSIPDFFLAGVLILIFSLTPLFFTIGAYVPMSESMIGNLRSIGLPILTLAAFGITLIARATREAVLRTLGSRHITTAVAMGQSPARILWRHVARNAAIPVVATLGLMFSYTIAGTVIVEVMFGIPGVGAYAFAALANLDYAIIQAAVLVSALICVMTSLVIDAVSALIDPRLAEARA